MKNKINGLLDKRFVSYILIFVIVFIPQGICALKAVPYLVYDEIGPLKFLGYITGEQNLGSLETAYYGWGTYIWMFPVYFITRNPIYRYRALCVFSALLQALSGGMAFAICRKYLIKREQAIHSICIAVIVGYICSYDIIIYNEHGLLFVNCLVLLLICKTFADGNHKEKYIFGAFLAALYGLTMHTRAIILVIALVFIVLIYWLFFKINLINKRQMVVLFLAGIGVRWMVKTIEQVIWVRYSSTGSVANTSLDVVTDKFKYIFGLEFWKTMWVYCFGQAYALNIVTGGVAILIFFSIAAYFANSKFNIGEPECQRNLFIILVFGICTAALIAGVGMQWGAPVYRDGLDIYGTDEYALKGINYVRYSLNYIVPLCILALAMSLDNFKRKYAAYCIFVQTACFLYWLNGIYPKIRNSYEYLSHFAGIIHRRPYTGFQYEKLFAIIFLTIDIIIILNFFNKKVLYFIFLDGFLIYSFMGSFWHSTYQYALMRSEYQLVSYEYIKEHLTDNELQSIDRMYAYNVDVNREQFYINEVKIVEGLPENGARDAVIMYYGDYLGDGEFLNEVSIDDYQIYTMADRCFLMVKGSYADLFDG